MASRLPKGKDCSGQHMKKNGTDFRISAGVFGLISAEKFSKITAALKTIVVVLCSSSHYNLYQWLFN
jgi:hypothetical protein